jgi:hypothetical protein
MANRLPNTAAKRIRQSRQCSARPIAAHRRAPPRLRSNLGGGAVQADQTRERLEHNGTNNRDAVPQSV